MTTDRPLRVTVLMGGPDKEHAVSLASGTAVAAALERTGRFVVESQVIGKPDASELANFETDVFFPVLHGPWGEGGGIQCELEQLGVPFVGSGADAAATAMDKIRTKDIAMDLGIPTPSWQVLEATTERTIAPPLVLKPPAEGSSIDLRIFADDIGVDDWIRTMHEHYDRLLVESCITGRELTVGVVGTHTLPMVEIIPADGVYDYEAKYNRNDTRYVVEPDLPSGLEETCRHHALTIGRSLGCRDLYRVDFIADERIPWMLEVNTMPGFTDHSLLPMAAAAAGRPMEQLCSDLVLMAFERSREDRPRGG